jgi:hypothetical protein
MATRGLYVQRLSTGEIHNVQVEDDAGSPLPMDPNEYIAKGYAPSIESLPDLKNFDANQLA